tara:strand:- start:12490 stop:13527 length:1038 start_codon:yes stop_codon:yes gene_type:complete
MDIAESLNQSSSANNYASAFNGRADQANQKATAKYNTTIGLAKAKATTFGTIDKGSAVGQGVAFGLTGAKEVGSARNFDSDIAGFGQGKGVGGYLRSQGQIIKGRMGQGSLRTQQALGVIDQNEYKDAVNNPSKLGLSQTIDARTNFARTGNLDAGRTSVPGKDTSGIEFGSKDLDTGKVVKADAEGASIVKASGGLLGASGKAETGLASSGIQKLGGFITDLPTSRLGAVADVGGKVLGGLGAVKGVYDLASGDDKTEGEKLGSVGDIVSGGLDALSVAMPVLAPVAAAAAGVSAIGDYFAGKDEQADTDKTASGKLASSTQSGIQVGSLSSSGKVASQSLSGY